MASWPKPFDASFLLFAATYLLDGALTWFALSHGLAREGNVLAAGLDPSSFLAVKAACLAAVSMLAWSAAHVHPPVVRGLGGLWRVALVGYSAVCVSNLAVLWGVAA